MKEVEFITRNQTEFLRYLKSRFTLIHLSNVFFRDIHYGVMDFLAGRGMKLTYTNGERVTRELGTTFEKAGILKTIDHQSWLLVYPEFALPRQEKVVEKKAPAAVAPPVANKV